MKDDPAEGCGYSPLIVNKVFAKHACDWHDKTYLKGSWHQENLSRKEVDQHFLKQMLLLANTPWRRLRAYAMYGIVRAVGGIFWEGER